MSKNYFLLQTLKHESVTNIVENLISIERITYTEIHDTIMAIATRRVTKCPSTESFNVRFGTKPPVQGKPPAMDLSKECSFCKKDGDTYQGPPFSSFLDQCFVDTDYPDLSTIEYTSAWCTMEWKELSWTETITHCNCDTNVYWAIKGSRNDQWIFNTGTSDHMYRTAFGSVTPHLGLVNAAGRQIKIVAISTTCVEGAIMPISLTRVLHVPELKNTNLISLRWLVENGFTM